MCAVPLRVRTDVIGALNLFRGSDEPFTVTEMEIAQAMAEMAAIGLIQERALRERNLLAVQLQGALNSRVIIEQAKGMIAEYLNIPVDDAFKLLQNYARDHNRKSSTALTPEDAERLRPYFAAHRRLRQLITELEAISIELAEQPASPPARTGQPRSARLTREQPFPDHPPNRRSPSSVVSPPSESAGRKPWAGLPLFRRPVALSRSSRWRDRLRTRRAPGKCFLDWHAQR